MELYHLKTFVAVAEEKNLTRASERLFTSQPAISAHIKTLEETLGVTLFDRTPKGMRLTPVGEDLLPHARQALAAASAFVQHAKGLQHELIASARIGLNSDARFLRIAALQAGLAERYPRLEVEIMGGSSATNLPALRIGKLDAAFISGERDEPTLTMLHLCDEPVAIAAPRALRDRLGDDFSVAALARLPWVFTSPDCAYYIAMQSLFAKHGCEPVRTALVNQDDAVVELVRSGAGLGIVRAGMLDAAGDSAFELPVPVIPIPLQFAYARKRANDPVIRALVSVLQDVWELGSDTDEDGGAVREAG